MIINSADSIHEKLGQNNGDLGKISIKTRQTDQYAELKISDSGNGIPSHIINNVFDPFFTTKEVGKGSGQGLSITHNIIVNVHKGQIFVDSEVGKGTTFTLLLPIESKNEN